MNRKFCLLLAALCLAVAVVKSESYIEVDENGDEYEVKRFNIQSRQLNEPKPQCVVTRRKRSTYLIQADDDSNENEGDQYHQGHAFLVYNPPVNGDDYNDAEEDDSDLEMPVQSKNKKHQKPNKDSAITTYGDIDEGDEDENFNEEEAELVGDEEENPSIEVVQVPQLPVIGHLNNKGQSVGAIAAAIPVSVPAPKPAPAPAAASATSSNNGIVVVQSVHPPKVNPQTHAVFELVPVNQEEEEPQGIAIDSNGQVVQISGDGFNILPGDENDENDDFNYNEELNPVTTTAIWSTGDDNFDFRIPVKKTKNKTKTSASKKKSKNKRKKTKKPKNPFLSPVTPNKVRRPLKTNNRQPQRPVQLANNNKNKRVPNRPLNNRRPYLQNPPLLQNPTPIRRPLNHNRRPLRPYRRRSTSVKRKQADRFEVTSPISDDDIDDNINDYNNDNQNGNTNENKNTNKNPNKNQAMKKRKNNNAGKPAASGGNGNYDCIFITKNPPTTTTPRPFFGLLGRNDKEEGRSSGHFGMRKRVNMRILT